MSGPLSSRFRVTAISCSARRPCALCTFPFLASGRLSAPHRRSPYRTPLPLPLFFFCEHGRRMPASSSGPPLLSFISSSAARAGSTPCFRPYLHSMHRLCIPSPPHPPPVCCFPPPFAYIRYPWSLLFFFIPIPLAFTAKLRNPIDVVKLGSSV